MGSSSIYHLFPLSWILSSSTSCPSGSAICVLLIVFSFVPFTHSSQIPVTAAVIPNDLTSSINTPSLLSPSSPSYASLLQSPSLPAESSLTSAPYALATAESPKISAPVQLLAPSSYSQSSECALVLQRTYVVNVPAQESTRSPLFAGFLNV